jgi:hypothetical protein
MPDSAIDWVVGDRPLGSMKVAFHCNQRKAGEAHGKDAARLAPFTSLSIGTRRSHEDVRANFAAAAALGSSCGEEACGLLGELLRKLEVRAVPRIWVEDQPGIR